MNMDIRDVIFYTINVLGFIGMGVIFGRYLFPYYEPVDISMSSSNITFQGIEQSMTDLSNAVSEATLNKHTEVTIEEEVELLKPLTRGVRNNNPCNLVGNNQEWFGQIGDDGRFMVFDTPEHGIRACAVMIRNYYDRHKLDTVKKIVARMAPRHENNTSKYTRQLARILKVGVDEKINLIERMHEVLAGIIFLENGNVPGYTDSLFIPYSYHSDM